MSHVIGRGRNARETYPQSPGGGGVNPNPGSLLRPPVDVAAGTTVNMASGGPNNFVGFDGVGAIVYNLPNNPQGGDVARFKMAQTGATPSIVNATGGANLENIGAPGTLAGVNGSTDLVGQGACVTLEFDASTLSGVPGTWRIASTV